MKLFLIRRSLNPFEDSFVVRCHQCGGAIINKNHHCFVKVRREIRRLHRREAFKQRKANKVNKRTKRRM
jgi:hypothetical protein